MEQWIDSMRAIDAMDDCPADAWHDVPRCWSYDFQGRLAWRGSNDEPFRYAPLGAVTTKAQTLDVPSKPGILIRPSGHAIQKRDRPAFEDKARPRLAGLHFHYELEMGGPQPRSGRHRAGANPNKFARWVATPAAKDARCR
ncbi:hypothetical protein MPL1032_180222 [Mesorhizobium plurifarium]|uniref:Uncharacterized protein n=1 Tax=Mesorhizobium plurifarium TaxID=69974 RepID=A0A0K2VTY6_MESPL|nr:hypothetical protein MPL1032_180222 [Mesorhizobium plurifarium]